MTSVYILYVTVREALQRQSSVHAEPFYIVIIFYSFCSEQRPRDVAVVGKITANQWWFLGSGKMETLSLDSTGRPPLSLPLSFSLQSATDDDIDSGSTSLLKRQKKHISFKNKPQT